jgi:hypothetical protein
MNGPTLPNNSVSKGMMMRRDCCYLPLGPPGPTADSPRHMAPGDGHYLDDLEQGLGDETLHYFDVDHLYHLCFDSSSLMETKLSMLILFLWWRLK